MTSFRQQQTMRMSERERHRDKLIVDRGGEREIELINVTGMHIDYYCCG